MRGNIETVVAVRSSYLNLTDERRRRARTLLKDENKGIMHIAMAHEIS